MRENIIRTVVSIISVFILIAGISMTLSSCAEDVSEETTTEETTTEETTAEEATNEETTAEETTTE
ncbi:MAG: hypothetical protein IKJ68_11710 [Clostridia bacterium]|nr:hypothetical protein [Clostridia bacterium]